MRDRTPAQIQEDIDRLSEQRRRIWEGLEVGNTAQIAAQLVDLYAEKRSAVTGAGHETWNRQAWDKVHGRQRAERDLERLMKNA